MDVTAPVPKRLVRAAGSRAAGITDPTSRALAVAAALPGVPLGGWAAAHLLGAVDIDGRTSAGALLPVPVCPGRSSRVRRREGIVLLRGPCGDEDVVEAHGVPVTSPVRTGFDLARGAPDLWAAVEEVDCLFRGRDPVFLDLLAAYAAARPRWKGVDRTRRATPLASTQTRSRGESWLRLVWTLTAGLPPPRLNTPVHDADDPHDAVVGTPDLLDEASGLAGEYDGSTHRSARQQHADAVRGDLMAGIGLTLVRATSIDRASAELMARRLHDAHRLALGVARRAWWVAPLRGDGAPGCDGAPGGRPAAGAVESAVAQRA